MYPHHQSPHIYVCLCIIYDMLYIYRHKQPITSHISRTSNEPTTQDVALWTSFGPSKGVGRGVIESRAEKSDVFKDGEKPMEISETFQLDLSS